MGKMQHVRFPNLDCLKNKSEKLSSFLILSVLQSEIHEYQHLQSEIEKPEKRRGRVVALSVLFFEKNLPYKVNFRKTFVSLRC